MVFIIKATMPPETFTMILKGRISYLDPDFHQEIETIIRALKLRCSDSVSRAAQRLHVRWSSIIVVACASRWIKTGTVMPGA